MKTILIFLAVICFSCGPTAKLRKAEKLIREAELQGAKWHSDTVYQTIVKRGDSTTIYVPLTELVTKDTTIYQDRIRLHYVTLRDTLRLQVECPPDTIKVPVTVYKSIVAPPCAKDRFWKGFGMGAAALIALLIVLGIIRAIKN